MGSDCQKGRFLKTKAGIWKKESKNKRKKERRKREKGEKERRRREKREKKRRRE